MKVLVPDFIDPLPSKSPDIQYYRYRPEEKIPQEHCDAEVLVVWGNKKPQIIQALQKMKQLQLIQLLSSGYDGVLPLLHEYSNNVVLCSGVGLHSYRVAEYCLMMCLNLLKEMPLVNGQRQQRFWPALELRKPQGANALHHKRLLICGFGSIGQQLARYLEPFEMTIRGVARTSGQRCGYPITTWKEALPYLAETDILVNVLPGSKETKDIFNKDVFKALPQHAIFVNAGRGSAVSDEDLIAALEEGEIAGAALDVVKKEPLSSDSPLWEAPNLLLTPHIGGNVPIGWQKLVAKNAEQLLLCGKKGGDFLNLVWRGEKATNCDPVAEP